MAFFVERRDFRFLHFNSKSRDLTVRYTFPNYSKYSNFLTAANFFQLLFDDAAHLPRRDLMILCKTLQYNTVQAASIKMNLKPASISFFISNPSSPAFVHQGQILRINCFSDHEIHLKKNAIKFQIRQSKTKS